MKILHTSDWHVGKAIRGRSRADEHRSVLAEITGIARNEGVDVVLVVGDLFETTTPSPEAEAIVFEALLGLAETGATVVVIAGNHDNPRRLQAVSPLLELGQVICRPMVVPGDEGNLVTVTSRDGTERARIAALPFLSQRYVVRAAELLEVDAEQSGQRYDARVRDVLAELCAGFEADTVNIVAAHLMTSGGRVGGGERPAHTMFDYEVGSVAFPSSASYVALGHLHRRQQIPGAAPIHYCGSPLQLDFGEVNDDKAVVLVEASPGVPAKVDDVRLSAGRRLRTITGTLADLRALAGEDGGRAGGDGGAVGDDGGADGDGAPWLKVVVREPSRFGLADEVRELFPDALDVVVEAPEDSAEAPERPSRSGRSPRELFEDYLAEQHETDPALGELFAELYEQVTEPATSSGSEARP